MSTLIEDPAVCQSTSLLDQFPLLQRSGIANQFFNAYRSGAETVDAIILAVKADALRRTLTEDGERLEIQRQLLSLIKDDEARLYAEQVITRESLPLEEKQRLKAERQDHYRREYLRAQSPTEKQLGYLRSLGCSVAPANRWEASEMIDGHVKG